MFNALETALSVCEVRSSSEMSEHFDAQLWDYRYEFVLSRLGYDDYNDDDLFDVD